MNLDRCSNTPASRCRERERAWGEVDEKGVCESRGGGGWEETDKREGDGARIHAQRERETERKSLESRLLLTSIESIDIHINITSMLLILSTLW